MPQAEKKSRKIYSPLFLGLTALFLALVIAYIFQKIRPVISFIPQLLLQKQPAVKEENGRTNILLLGISGGTHDGANLTDSIIFISADFKNRDVVMLSVPRDIWIPSLKAKINSVYYYGEKKKTGGGFILAKSSISEVLGVSPQYTIKLDFSTFEKIIDQIGGIDIDVTVPFEDKLYPIPGKENDFCGGDPKFMCRYETLKFDKGLQHMDGARALKYVRSRYSGDGEGTDFSRSRRQQEVISAIIAKVKPMVKLNNLGELKKLYDEVNKNIETDLSTPDMLQLGKYYFSNQGITPRKLVLDTGDDIKKIPGLLKNPPVWEYNGQWVLVPRSGDFNEIHEYVSCELAGKTCVIKP